MSSPSFVPQRLDRVHLRHAASRKVSKQHADCRREQKRQRVDLAYGDAEDYEARLEEFGVASGKIK